MEDPSWSFRCISDAQEKSKFDELSASDTLLLGLVTEDADTTGNAIRCNAQQAAEEKAP